MRGNDLRPVFRAAGAYVGQGFEYEYSGGSGLTGNLDAWLTANGIGVK